MVRLVKDHETEVIGSELVAAQPRAALGCERLHRAHDNRSLGREQRPLVARLLGHLDCHLAADHALQSARRLLDEFLGVRHDEHSALALDGHLRDVREGHGLAEPGRHHHKHRAVLLPCGHRRRDRLALVGS